MSALLWAGLMAAPQVLAHDTLQPIAHTEGGSGVTAVSAGGYNGCVLKTDGTVACWGTPSLGLTTPVARTYLSVSVGSIHICGVKTDGTLACWGSNIFGKATPPAGTYLSVSAGSLHSCGLKADGTVACWGSNLSGRSTPVAGTYLSVSAGGDHSCGVKTDGAVACWGLADAGRTTPVAGTYLSVSTGGAHSCGVKTDGTVACWGVADDGRTTPVAGTYLSVSAGGAHSCGVKTDGTVACWGYDSHGQATPPTGTFLSVSAGGQHSCGVKSDGATACWGLGGPLTTYGDDQSKVPDTLSSPGAIAFGQIAAGNAHACQVRRDGTLSCWGQNTYGGDVGAATPPSGLFTQVVAGDSHSCAIGIDGTVACWGRNANVLNNHDALSVRPWRQLAPAPNGAICGLGAGTTGDVCTRTEGGAFYHGFTLRNITHARDDSFFPGLCGVSLHVAGGGWCDSPFDAGPNGFPGPWQRLESGLAHQCGLTADGRIECWGDNTSGQMTGLAQTEFDATPVWTLSGLFRAFSVGWNHACAIRDNGQLACWGSNLNAQATPPAGTFVQVAAGNTFTCAIRDDGVRVCWGDDAHGQAPQLALAPGNIADGLVGTAHAGASFSLADAGQNADGDYVPQAPAFYADPDELPPGLTLSPEGVLSGMPTAGGSYTFTVEGEDANGFTASRAYTLTIIADSTPPAIDYTLTGGPVGSNGWYHGDVGITWSVVDPQSVVTRIGCVDSTLSGDTAPAGVSYSCSASSAGGSAGPVSVILKRDATAPTASLSPSPAANASGWHKADVTILASCSDSTPGSGIASCPSVPAVTSEGSTVVPSQAVQDNAGNSGSSNSLTVKLDRTAPGIVAAATSGPDGNNGWYRSNATVRFTCSDALSGLSGSCPLDQLLTAEGSAVTSSAQSIHDNAGNTGTSNVVTVKIDKTAPTLAPTTPGPILRGQSYSASPNAADAPSGLASQSCGALDTSTLGSKSTTCSATDNAGNNRTVTLNYSVTTTCSNDGYSGTQLTWCRNICEMGYTGATLDSWIHRWTNKYRDLPYCRVGG